MRQVLHREDVAVALDIGMRERMARLGAGDVEAHRVRGIRHVDAVIYHGFGDEREAVFEAVVVELPRLGGDSVARRVAARRVVGVVLVPDDIERRPVVLR